MKLAIMQPYFFPYIGYFQLCYAADKFVFLDDVNFIKKGWINRNNILVNGSAHLFTIPLKNASQNREINTIETAIDEKWLNTFYRTLQQSYKNAPHYNTTAEIIHSVVDKPYTSIGALAKQSIVATAHFLGLKTEFVDSSSQYHNRELKGQDRILNICLTEKASDYINAYGGMELYQKETFSEKSVQLNFLKSQNLSYSQFGGNFVPWLSIIDVMMFNSLEQIRQLLSKYELV